MFKKFSILIFVAATLFIFDVARADTAAGQYILNFDAPVSLWDISGDYEDVVDGFTLDYTITADPKGHFMGQGTFNYVDENGNEIDGAFTFTGRMRTSGKVTRVTMRSKLSGTGDVEGFDATLAGRLRNKLEIDPDALQLAGKATASFRIRAPGFVNSNGVVRVPDFVSDIPLGMNGAWQLTMNVFPNNSNYTGNATIDLSNNARYSFDLTGRQNVHDFSKFRLKGDVDSPAARFSLNTTVSNDVMNVVSMNGKLLGQHLRLKP